MTSVSREGAALSEPPENVAAFVCPRFRLFFGRGHVKAQSGKVEPAEARRLSAVVGQDFFKFSSTTAGEGGNWRVVGQVVE